MRKRLLRLGDVSDWQRPQDAGFVGAPEVIRSGELPRFQHSLIDGAAGLSATELEQLATGRATAWTKSPSGG